MKLFVDADASPVKDIVIQAGADFHLPVILVSSISHFSNQPLPDYVQTIYVDNQKEAADYRIVALAQKGDVVITQDYGLASLLLSKGCIVLHHSGMRYTGHNIDNLLQNRYLSALSRKSGKHTKGPKAFTDENKEKFREILYALLTKETQKEQD